MVDNDVAENEVFGADDNVEIVALKSATNILPQLPSWTDGPAITSYIVTVAGILFGFLALMHVGLPVNTPALVQVWATIIGPVVAGVAQAINLITHRTAHLQAWAWVASQRRRLHSADGN
jgi:protein-S-isoprenylcysteine O-methyltransferase Ste14